MRRWLTVLVAVTLVGSTATACRFSKVKSDATVHISGRALGANGKPLANTKVQLFKEADFGEAVLGFVFTIGTLGASCLLPEAPSICSHAKTATTDSDGRYTFTVTGRDTQGLVGNESTLDVLVADPAAGKDGPSTTVTFAVRKNDVTLPTARLWGTRIGTTRPPAGPQSVSATWNALPSSAGTNASYALRIFGPSGQTLWTQTATRSAGFMDARILEDQSGQSLAASAHTSLSGGTGAGNVHGNYYSKRVALTFNAGAPPSRGKACSAVTGIGLKPKSSPQPSPCKITDGDFGAVARLTGPKGAVVDGAIVDLGAVRSVSLVVARGLGGDFVIEVSSNGTTYRQIGVGSGSAVAVMPRGGPTSARYVRVRATSGLDESLMTELSVW